MRTISSTIITNQRLKTPNSASYWIFGEPWKSYSQTRFFSPISLSWVLTEYPEIWPLPGSVIIRYQACAWTRLSSFPKFLRLSKVRTWTSDLDHERYRSIWSKPLSHAGTHIHIHLWYCNQSVKQLISPWNIFFWRLTFWSNCCDYSVDFFAWVGYYSWNGVRNLVCSYTHTKVWYIDKSIV